MTTNNLRWPGLLSVQVGGAICLPMLMVGFLVGQSLPLGSALTTIFVGNGILASLACYMSLVATKARKTTPELAATTFGPKAGFVFSLVFMLNLLGWFGIHLVAMADLIAARFSLEKNFVAAAAVVMLGLVITVSVLGGIAWLEKIAIYSLPLLLFGMVSLVDGETYVQSWQQSRCYGLDLTSMLLVVSGLFGAIVDLPTYFCRAKSSKDAIIASLLLFLVVVPFIEILGLGISSSHGANDFAPQVMQTSFGLMRDLFLAFCIFAGWTTNNCNLFSAQTFLSAIQSRSNALAFRQRVILTGSVGTLVGLLTLQIPFKNFLIAISIPLLFCGALLMLLSLRRPTC